MSRSYPFVQHIVVDGQKEILPDHVLSCSVIESGDMSGTKLLLQVSDRYAYYRDELGITEGTELEITCGDPDGRGDDIFIDTYVVMPPVAIDGMLKIEGFQKQCHQLKQPAREPQFFVDQAPDKILKALIPDAKIEADHFSQRGTYHLNPGASRSRLIRSMARDYGAMAFYSRGTFYFLNTDNLLSGQAELTIEHNNPMAEASIHSYQINDQTFMYRRVLNRRYVRWDTVAGLETSEGDPENGTVMITAPNPEALDNQADAVIPLLVAELLGNSLFAPGKVLNVILNLNSPEKVIDETMPEVQVINQVTHHQQNGRYHCRLELGVPNA